MVRQRSSVAQPWTSLVAWLAFRAALRASMGTMLDALQAQDRVSQTLDLVRRVIVAAGLAHSGAAASSGEALLRDIARRSQAVQPGIAAEVAALIEQHLAGPAPE
jgi:hypothetical protein